MPQGKGTYGSQVGRPSKKDSSGYAPFKMKGHTLPGINQRSEGNTDTPDGRSKSSALQQKKETQKKGNLIKNENRPLREHNIEGLPGQREDPPFVGTDHTRPDLDKPGDFEKNKLKGETTVESKVEPAPVPKPKATTEQPGIGGRGKRTDKKPKPNKALLESLKEGSEKITKNGVVKKKGYPKGTDILTKLMYDPSGHRRRPGINDPVKRAKKVKQRADKRQVIKDWKKN